MEITNVDGELACSCETSLQVSSLKIPDNFLNSSRLDSFQARPTTHFKLSNRPRSELGHPASWVEVLRPCLASFTHSFSLGSSRKTMHRVGGGPPPLVAPNGVCPEDGSPIITRAGATERLLSTPRPQLPTRSHRTRPGMATGPLFSFPAAALPPASTRRNSMRRCPNPPEPVA